VAVCEAEGAAQLAKELTLRAASSPKKEKALKELRDLRAEVAQAKDAEAVLQARLETVTREVRIFEMWS
jgi:hypothetical protein